MKLTKRLKTCLVLFLILSFAATAVAAPGKYTRLKKGAIADWDAWCFDEKAVAELLIKKEIQDERCDFRLSLALDKQRAKHNLEVGKLLAKMDYEVKTSAATIDALKQQNETLENELAAIGEANVIVPASLGAIVGALIVTMIWSVSK